MFKDAITGKISKPGEKMIQIVTEVRPRVYSKKIRNLETREIETVEVGRGEEIVKMIGVTQEGADIYYETHPLVKTGNDA